MAKRRASIKDAPAPAKANRWSFTSWCERRKCAFAYYCKFIRGMKEPERPMHPAMERGIELHKKSEHYLKGDVTKLPKSMKSFWDEYAELKRMNPIVEQFWGVGPNWKPMQWNSWVVMKMDAAVAPCKKTDHRLVIIDLKTGREKKEDHEAQGGLYAAIGYAMYPRCEGIDVEFWYTDLGYPTSFQWTIPQLEAEKQFWMQEGRNLLTVHDEKYYKPNPSEENCRWCFLRSDRGGPCGAWKVGSAKR